MEMLADYSPNKKPLATVVSDASGFVWNDPSVPSITSHEGATAEATRREPEVIDAE